MAVNHFEQLAEQTKRVMEERKWSLRQAERQTGIGYGTIQNMTQGRRPAVETVVAWAQAIRERSNKWLEWAGYEVVASSLAVSVDGRAFDVTEVTTHYEQPLPSGPADMERIERDPAGVLIGPPAETREPVFDDLVEAGYDTLPEDERDEIRELIKMKVAKERRRQTTHGKLAV